MNTTRADFEAAFDQVSAFLKTRLGHSLFTVSRSLPGGLEVERIYSSRPSNYPVGGRNAVDQTEWTRQMDRGEIFVANQPSEFGPHFHNLDTIVSEGFGAVVNIPVSHDGRRMGGLNLLDCEGAYRGDVLSACHEASAMAVAGFLAYEKHLQLVQSTVRPT